LSPAAKPAQKAAMANSDTKTLQTRHGPMIALAGDRYITRSLEMYGEFSPGESSLFAQVVKPGMTVIEVGANIGAHSVALARNCFPGPLFVFEPQQRVFQILCANLALNDVRNAIAYPEACSDVEDVVVVPALDYGAEFNFGGVAVQAAGESVQGLRTRAAPLDNLGLAACHLIKIDVEGYEAQVLRGAAATIARCRPLLYVENDRPDRQQEVISLVAEMGYRLYWHLPPLFTPDNFNGCAEDVFGPVVSINMFCLPRELGAELGGLAEIDPLSWSCPARSKP
jgi:FkbM family methyltransferase